MATLLEKHNASTNGDFQARVLMAVIKRAGVELGSLTGSESYYDDYVKAARYAWEAEPSGVEMFARVLAANGLSDANTDQEISDAVVTNWSIIAKAFKF